MKVNRVGFYIGFTNVSMSSWMLGSGVGKWAYDQFENLNTLGAAIFFAILLMLLALTSKEQRLVLKQDKTYRRNFIMFFILNFIIVAVITSVWFSYIFISLVFTIPYGLLLVRMFIKSYEELTDEKL
ncbi:hypothetical protein [Vibrio aphrogenes]|uniref:hypothetical protein n=1 Tax=Vibrio aphrogenes TaxID=1891186 RepID=UPI000B34D700|nr:hypothetical protein [Vibrio aphrogenes]